MLQYTKVESDAEDIVQSTFLKVWEKRTTLAEIEKPESWLFITARNIFLNRFDKLRSEAGYKKHIKELFEEEYGSPEDMLITRQSHQLVQNAVNTLPQKQKEAFSMSRMEGMTYAQIAESMGVTRETVKEHISRATKTVTAFLKNYRDSVITWTLIIATTIFIVIH